MRGVYMSRFDNQDLKTTLMQAKENDQPAIRYLIRNYQSLINTIINKGLYLKNGDRDDLFAEGLIGLNRAIKDFDDEKGNAGNFQKNLENFFYMCIQRSLISAIKTSNRKKNTPLNDMTSLDRPLQENENLTAMDIIAARDDIQYSSGLEFMNPEEQLILEDSFNTYNAMLNSVLSDSEKEVYSLRKLNYSYKEIKNILGYDKAKPIDNALQRVKTKLNQIVEQEERRTRSVD
jgi:RNA polymerase sporulation-specific sigma factor